ncbi:hypothetical protein BHE74_00013437 [Ensete ventricosum]|nr:hypothetical protein BHE74_00013437 [Ensete ventricosum]RZR73075.1 hypothetical protein BHM03_00019758 [Ensete ventricosum]
MSAIVSRLIHSPSSVSRALSGRSSIRESWADKVEWLQGSLLVPESWKDVMNDVTAVVCRAAEAELLTKFTYGG